MKIKFQERTWRGPGFLSLLTLLFVAGKITGHLTWSWLWVFAPLWIPTALLLAFVLLLVIVGGVFNDRS